MNRNYESGILPSPERREGLYIHSIIIPADEEQPLRQHELPREGLAARQELVGGLIQGIDMGEPPGRIYCNEDGKYLKFPPNKRATLLLWLHNPRFRFRDFIVGDAFLVGPPKRGADSDVSSGYLQALFEAQEFHVEVKALGSNEWRQHPRPFDDWVIAYEHAVGWSAGSGHQLDVRVVPQADAP